MVVAVFDVIVAALCATSFLFGCHCSEHDDVTNASDDDQPDVIAEEESRLRGVSQDYSQQSAVGEESHNATGAAVTELTMQAPGGLHVRAVRRPSYAARRQGPRARERSGSMTAVDALLLPHVDQSGAPFGSATSITYNTGSDRLTTISDQSATNLAFNCISVSMLVAVSLFFAVNGARDAILTGLLYTYAVKYAGWSTDDATLLVTVYHVTRVVIHVAVVCLARWVTPFKLSVANVVVFLVSSAFLLATVQQTSHAFLIAGIVMTGFASSNVHPTAITLAKLSFEVNTLIADFVKDGKICSML